MVTALTHIDDLEWYNRTLYFDKKLTNLDAAQSDGEIT